MHAYNANPVPYPHPRAPGALSASPFPLPLSPQFSHSGSRITVSAWEGEDAALHVAVDDDGEGLSSAELELLEGDEPFAQVGRGLLQGSGGTGLGLTIVRHILRLHGDGSLLRLSSPGTGLGTRFEMVLHLPRAAAALVPHSMVATPLPVPEGVRPPLGTEPSEAANISPVIPTTSDASATGKEGGAQAGIRSTPLLNHATLPSPLRAASSRPASAGDAGSRRFRTGQEMEGVVNSHRAQLPGVWLENKVEADAASWARVPAPATAAEERSFVLYVEVRTQPRRLRKGHCSRSSTPRTSPVLRPTPTLLAPRPPGAHLTSTLRHSPLRTGCGVATRQDDAMLQLAVSAQVITAMPPGSLDLVTAGNGVEALALVDARRRNGEAFDLIVIDNQMPSMGGRETVARLREGGYFGVIVGMTGDPVGSEDRTAFEAAGLDLCVDKTSTGLQALVRELDRIRRRSRGVSS